MSRPTFPPHKPERSHPPHQHEPAAEAFGWTDAVKQTFLDNVRDRIARLAQDPVQAVDAVKKIHSDPFAAAYETGMVLGNMRGGLKRL